jgi:hypothetical protein
MHILRCGTIKTVEVFVNKIKKVSYHTKYDIIFNLSSAYTTN